MRMLDVLRLPPDVYGARWPLVRIVAPPICGVLPCKGRLRLGALPFHALVAAAFALWPGLRRARAPRAATTGRRIRWGRTTPSRG